MKINIKKLSLYSLSGAAFLSSHENADAQIIYHDLDPDSFIGHTLEPDGSLDTLEVDFNDDGDPDIRFTAKKFLSLMSGTFSSTLYLISSQNMLSIDNFDAVVNDPSYPLSFGARNLYSGDIVGPDASWNTADQINLLSQSRIESSHILSTNYPFQNWKKENNILGVRFLIGSETHYGWIRLGIKKIGWPSHRSFPELVIQDYAYEVTADTPIMIKNPAADLATNVMLTDIAETNTINDLQASFTKAGDESTIEAYHVFITPTAGDAESFLLSKEFLETLPADRYYSIIPSGTDISFSLDNTVKDVFGDTLVIGTYYNIFVLSVGDTDIVSQNSLSLPSSREKASLRLVNNPSHVYLEYAESNLDISDFTVHFKGGGDWGHSGQEGIVEYRVFITSEYHWFVSLNDTLDIQDAEYYVSVPPDSSGVYAVTLTPDKKVFDSPSDSLLLFQKYSCAVLAVPDNLSYSVSTVGVPYWDDDYVAFYYPHYNVTPVLSVTGSTGTLHDIQLYFPKFYNEPDLDEYRIMLVKESDTASFDALAAHFIPWDNYIKIEPDGEDLNEELEKIPDIYGIDIDPAEQYYVYVGLQGHVGAIKDISLSNPSLMPALSTGFATFSGNASVFVDNDIIYITYPEQFTADLYSISGQLIAQYVNCINSLTINCNDLSAGQYILKIKTAKGLQTERISLK